MNFKLEYEYLCQLENERDKQRGLEIAREISELFSLKKERDAVFEEYKSEFVNEFKEILELQGIDANHKEDQLFKFWIEECFSDFEQFRQFERQDADVSCDIRLRVFITRPTFAEQSYIKFAEDLKLEIKDLHAKIKDINMRIIKAENDLSIARSLV